MAFRSILHTHLSIDGWKRQGLSPTNKLLCGLIVFAGLFAIVSTEPDAVAVSPVTFRAIELTLAIVFTVEYLARVYAAGESSRYGGWIGRIRYMLTPLALIDLVAVVPLYFAFLPTNAALLRLCRLMGILRFAKLGRYSQAVRLITEAVHSRRFELGLSVAAGAFILIVSPTLLYLTEGDTQPDKFGSIPRSLWWSIVTLTTVGYGDVFPVTPIGKVLAAATAVIGIGLIAMPTGILAAAFSEIFQRHRSEYDRGARNREAEEGNSSKADAETSDSETQADQ